MPTTKFYVVWKGRTTGIFTSWEECRRQVIGFKGAIYKSFPTEQEARTAMSTKPTLGLTKQRSSVDKTPAESIVADSIAVDAACSGNPGPMEYRGVETLTGKEIFREGPFENGTNNIGEFLAIVHGLELLSRRGSSMAVYSDSLNAMLWVERKKCGTKLKPCSENDRIFELIKHAEYWLNNNTYPNRILKWDTASFGEIPADFGRK
ncbi:MAG: ribonuclease H family protein [Dysgonamonadaceae bacterium]|jgi:ribonuclease HI|nr:ribonuclease H family protein [Dysgonamonadaceae bacterium]